MRPDQRVGAFLLASIMVVVVAAGALSGVGCRPELAGGAGGAVGGWPGTGGATPGGTPGGTTPPSSPPPGAGPVLAACPLCGLAASQAALLHRPLAVAIDNLAVARPQSGLNDACLVYEVLAEGGVTRLLAFFLHNDSAAIGPVRSLRPYLLDLAMPLGAVVAHVGGSPQALSDVKALEPTAMTVDEVDHESYFWRSEIRRAPHNVYTGASLLRTASQVLGYEGARLGALTPRAFSFSPPGTDAALPAGQAANRFTLSYAGTDGYTVTYDYDSESEQWMRYIRGAVHSDAATGKQLRATTVIVQYVSSWTIPGDEAGRLDLALTGSGEAQVFCRGKSFDAAWTKGGPKLPCVFTGSLGDSLTLPPGPVWVLVAPPGSQLDVQ